MLPPFYLDNIEVKHQGLTLCCLALGHYIDPDLGVATKRMPLMYRFFANNKVILRMTNDEEKHPNGLTFTDEFENVLVRKEYSHVFKECSTVGVYYISWAPSAISTNEVFNVAQALSEQVSDSKIAYSCPHPMGLCTSLVNSLI